MLTTFFYLHTKTKSALKINHRQNFEINDADFVDNETPYSSYWNWGQNATCFPTTKYY